MFLRAGVATVEDRKYRECRILIPAPDQHNQNLNFNRIPQLFIWTFKFEKHSKLHTGITCRALKVLTPRTKGTNFRNTNFWDWGFYSLPSWFNYATRFNNRYCNHISWSYILKMFIDFSYSISIISYYNYYVDLTDYTFILYFLDHLWMLFLSILFILLCFFIYFFLIQLLLLHLMLLPETIFTINSVFHFRCCLESCGKL